MKEVCTAENNEPLVISSQHSLSLVGSTCRDGICRHMAALGENEGNGVNKAGIFQAGTHPDAFGGATSGSPCPRIPVTLVCLLL